MLYKIKLGEIKIFWLWCLLVLTSVLGGCSSPVQKVPPPFFPLCDNPRYVIKTYRDLMEGYFQALTSLKVCNNRISEYNKLNGYNPNN